MHQTDVEIPPDPSHVAIVMDGNGRWAQKQGLPRREGHRTGVNNVRNILETSKELGIRYLTLFAFSAENWHRPSEEVNLLMHLLKDFLREKVRELLEHEIRFHVIGDFEKLPEEVRKAIHDTMRQTEHFDKHILTLALNYGARQEVLHAVREILKNPVSNPDALTFEDLQKHFYTRGLPDPDLIIRTSGEYRLSNFLLLQSAYSEFIFSPKYWPEFGSEDLKAAVDTYRKRERRFGKIGEQIQGNLAGPLPRA